MDTSELVPLIELLDDNIDDLEEALEPLLSGPLVENAGKLPLLDKAQLYVLVTYAIESILFSSLRLSGVNAKEHPVFRELARVKQYFEKIKAAESSGDVPNARLDKGVAGRLIEHGLSGNVKHDQMLAKRLVDRKAVLQEKLASHNAQKGGNKASVKQQKERDVVAEEKARDVARKRKLKSESENEPDGNKDSDSPDSSDLYESELVGDSALANASESGVPVSPKRSQKQSTKSPKKKRTNK